MNQYDVTYGRVSDWKRIKFQIIAMIFDIKSKLDWNFLLPCEKEKWIKHAFTVRAAHELPFEFLFIAQNAVEKIKDYNVFLKFKSQFLVKIKRCKK